MNQPVNLKKPLLILAALIVVFVGGRIAFHYLTTGRLVVTASGATSISVSSLANSSDKLQLKGSSATLRLKPGSYSVTAQKGDSATQQTATVTARHTTNTTVILHDIGSIEPVSPRSIIGVYGDKNQLVYYDSNNDNLYRVGSDNREQAVSTPISFTNIQWADSSYGVAEGTDGNLYEINGNTMTQLSLPSNNSYTGFAVGGDRRLYVSYLNDLYVRTAGSGFRHVSLGSIKHPFVVSAGSDNNVLLKDVIRSTATANGDSNLVEGLVVVSNGVASQEVRYNAGHGKDFEAAWSPDNQKLLIKTPDTTIITDANLNTLTRLPTNAAANPLWVTDTLAAYTLDTNVWGFNTSDNSSYVLGTSYNHLSLSTLYSAHDNDHTYVVIQNTSTGQQLGRLSTQNPQEGSGLVSLSAILPTTLDECSLGYVNVTSLVVTAYGPDTSAQDCTAKTNDYLKSYQSVLGNRQLPIQFIGS